MESIITAIITGGLALVGVIISNYSSNKEVEKAIQCFLGQPSLNFSECNIGDIVIVTNPQ